jgi:Mg/Co/Ni transporter MgtE
MIKLIEKVSAEVKVNSDPMPDGILGFVRQFGGTEASLGSVVAMIEKAIEVGLTFAGVFALIMFLWGAFDYMFSLGDDEKVKKSSQTMLWSFIGLVIIAAARTILNRVIDLLK